MITPFKQALGNAQLAIASLVFALVLAMALNFYLGFCLYRVPDTQMIYVPPYIPSNGLQRQVGTITASEVYAFTYYIWQSLQTWQADGAKDYHDNLERLSPYLTADFKNALTLEAKARFNEGFLQGHQQATFGAEGSNFEPESVRYLGHDTWLVHLVMRTVNRVIPANGSKAFQGSHVASDAKTSFVFKVVRTDYAPDKNHWQLALAGFAAEPKVLQSYQAEDA